MYLLQQTKSNISYDYQDIVRSYQLVRVGLPVIERTKCQSIVTRLTKKPVYKTILSEVGHIVVESTQ